MPQLNASFFAAILQKTKTSSVTTQKNILKIKEKFSRNLNNRNKAKYYDSTKKISRAVICVPFYNIYIKKSHKTEQNFAITPHRAKFYLKHNMQKFKILPLLC
jgi:hypothetical protein